MPRPKPNLPPVALVTLLREAMLQGYRVTQDGRLTRRGKTLTVKLAHGQAYPTTTITFRWCGKTISRPVPVHKLCAAQKYHRSLFENDPRGGEGVVVRHLNDDPMDFRPDNIEVGSYSQNELDKDPEVRSRVARQARAAQLGRPSIWTPGGEK